MNGFVIKGVVTPGWFGDMSKEIKKVVKIPVLLTGGITSKNEANQILEDEKAD